MTNEKIYKFVARNGFVTRNIAGDTVLVPINSGNVYIQNEKETEPIELPMFNGMIQLNDVALFLWNALSEPKTISDLVTLIEKEFDVKNIDVEKDITEFLQIGITNQLIFIIDDSKNE